MTEVLLIALPILLVATVVSLGLGLVTLAGDDERHRRRSNRLMQWRVGLQGLAVIVLLALVAFAG